MRDEKAANLPDKLGKWVVRKRLASRIDKIVLLGECEGEFAALKIIKNADLMDERERARFDQEVLNLMKINNPHIPRIVDLDLVDAMQPWIATEFVSGPTLQDRVSIAPLKLDEWFKALKEITEALFYIHSNGIYHRDISPSNIILSDEGAKLIDFGMSFLEDSQTITKTGIHVQGTPVTVSPESLTFRRDPKMDMFSLGSTFIFAGTGKYPFQVEEAASNWMESILYEAPHFYDLVESQKRLVTPLMYKDLRDRVSSKDYFELLSEVSLQKRALHLKSNRLDELLKSSDQKLHNLRFDAKREPSKRSKRSRFLFSSGLGILASSIFISQNTRLGFLDQALIVFLGLIPLAAVSIGLVSFFRGLGSKKWGKRRFFVNAGLSIGGIVAPYVATIIFFLASMTPFTFQNFLQDTFGRVSSPQTSFSPRIEPQEVSKDLQDNSPRTLEIQILIDSARESIQRKNYSKALSEASKAAQLGSAEAFHLVGEVKQFQGDLVGAKESYLMAIDLNYPEAFWSMGQTAMQEGNSKEAVDWWKEGKRRNNASSLRSLANHYLNLNKGKKFVSNMRLAANLNDQIAMFELARYWSGKAINGEEALYWAKEASNRGLNGASVLAGWFYEAIEEWNLANFYYKRASDRGDPEGMLYLARLEASRSGKSAEVCKLLSRALDASMKAVPFEQPESAVSNIFVEDEIRTTIRGLCAQPLESTKPAAVKKGNSGAAPSDSRTKSNNSPSVLPSSKPSPDVVSTPIKESDKFQLSSPLASNVLREGLFGRPWMSADMYWNIPLQVTSSSVVPDLTGIQFRPLGNTQGPWFEVPYKLKVSQTDKTVYAQVDAILFATLSKNSICPEFRVVKEVGGVINKIWEKSLPECATDYNP